MNKYALTILTILLLATVVYSQADIGIKAVGGRLGYVMPEDPIDNTFGLGLNADLGTITPVIGLHAFVDYWSKSYDVSGFGSDYEASFSVIALGALAIYNFEIEGSINPYAGGGLGFNIGKAKSEYMNPFTGSKEEDSASETDIAIHLLGGASMELSPTLDGFAEIKYVISDVEYFGIYVGVLYKLK